MVVSVTLLDRSIGQSGNVLYTFSDGFIVEYCSEADAEGDAVLDADRVKSVLRRSQFEDTAVTQPILRSGDLEIDFTKRSVTVAGNAVNLTPTEYNLLQELVLKRGKALTHSYLLQKVWGPEYLSETEYLHVFIGRLRSKLHLDSRDQKYVMTLPGVGYQFKEAAQVNT